MEFPHKKLNQKNIGFQMLQKMGWQEGRGLGSRGKGIKEPVKVYVMEAHVCEFVTREYLSYRSLNQALLKMIS